MESTEKTIKFLYDLMSKMDDEGQDRFKLLATGIDIGRTFGMIEAGKMLANPGEGEREGKGVRE